MMEYYLICYDICDNKKRTKLAQYLRKMGFRRIQKSVFIGRIKSKKSVLLVQELSLLIEFPCDSLIVMPISQTVVGNTAIIGQGNEKLVWLKSQSPLTNFL